MSAKKAILAAAAALLGLETAISLAHWPPPNPIPANGNAQMLQGAQVGKDVLAILDRSCRDCHSDLTHYPWYAYLSPVSTLINKDVARGREFLNLSRWHEYSAIRRQRALTGIANQTRDRLMPLDIYLRLHPSARLSDADIEAVFAWTQAERLRLIQDSLPVQ